MNCANYTCRYGFTQVPDPGYSYCPLACLAESSSCCEDHCCRRRAVCTDYQCPRGWMRRPEPGLFCANSTDCGESMVENENTPRCCRDPKGIMSMLVGIFKMIPETVWSAHPFLKRTCHDLIPCPLQER